MITRLAPSRSAIAPANGSAAPQSRFCTASAMAKTSRPQPLAWDSGVRKKPSAERGPNATMETRQPQIAITAGVRQPIDGRCVAAELMDIEFLRLLQLKTEGWLNVTRAACWFKLAPNRYDL